MKIDQIFEDVAWNPTKLTQCLEQFIMADPQRWKHDGVASPQTMFAKGLCGMWAYFAQRVNPSLVGEETENHAWVKDPATGLLYDAYTQGVKSKKKLTTPAKGEVESQPAKRWGERISTGNFAYDLSEEEEQSILKCYHS